MEVEFIHLNSINSAQFLKSGREENTRMEVDWSYLVYSTIILLPALIFITFQSKFTSITEKLPPGPTGWPVFGHMFNLGGAPHRTIAALQENYGPVVWLKLGSVNTMAILTAKAAAEFFKNHDLSFADRSIVETMTAQGYHHASMAISPYGSRWRMLRRICTVEMFVTKRINETAAIRRKCVEDMLSWIEKEVNRNSEGNFGICVGRYVFLAAFNMLGNLMMSRDLADPESDEGMEFYGAMKRLMEYSGTPNVSDLFPWIRCIDPQGLKRRANRDMGIALGIASGFVKERIQQRETGGGNEKDFLDLLLEFDGADGESGKLTEKDINIFILEMFFAGTETTSTSIEWAMAELLRHPETMTKLKTEISAAVGASEKFQESHIENLPYLHAVIKETLRLHPPLPLLLPRRAVRDTNFMGYFVPQNTQVFVNIWAIGRDQECWDDALCFKPERFLGKSVDYKGQHFEYIPFGAGRRMCAGLTLGHRMLHFVLGSLIHEFYWELEICASPDDVDMKERMGITVGKFEALKAVPKKCVF